MYCSPLGTISGDRPPGCLGPMDSEARCSHMDMPTPTHALHTKWQLHMIQAGRTCWPQGCYGEGALGGWNLASGQCWLWAPLRGVHSSFPVLAPPPWCTQTWPSWTPDPALNHAEGGAAWLRALLAPAGGQVAQLLSQLQACPVMTENAPRRGVCPWVRR